MRVLTAILVDDERLARRGLALHLQNIPQIEVIHECANAQQALKAIHKHNPDLVFLDIQMPEMSGLEMICELQADAMPMIVFVTAFDKYAVEAFDVNAVDYVLKPIDEERLQIAVNRAIQRGVQKDLPTTKQQVIELMKNNSVFDSSLQTVPKAANTAQWPERLSIKDGNKITLVKAVDIHWVDAAGDYMCVHTKDKTHIMRSTMKQLETLLNPDIFLRIHRSTIVNSRHITGAQTFPNGEYQLILDDETKLKVSRSYSHKIKSLLGE